MGISDNVTVESVLGKIQKEYNSTDIYAVKDNGIIMATEGTTNFGASFLFPKETVNLNEGIKIDIDDKLNVIDAEKTEVENVDEALADIEVNKANVNLNLIWENGTPKVTYEETTGADVTIQYMIGTEGALKDATGGVISESTLKLGDTVFVIVSKNGKQKDGGSVLVLDETKPVITKFEITGQTANSITVGVTARDNESGLATTGTYTYYKNGTKDGSSSTSNTHVYSSLKSGTYTLKVEVVDKAGNKASTEINGTIKDFDVRKESGNIYISTAHNYSDNMSATYSDSISGARKLIFEFSSDSRLEDSYDYVEIYDGSGTLYYTSQGNGSSALSSLTVEIPGDSFTIKMYSDSSTNYYGFDCVVSGSDEEYVGEESGENGESGESGESGAVSKEFYVSKESDKIYISTPHNYADDMDTTYSDTISGAKVLVFEFSSESYLEDSCDYVEIYDGSGTLYYTSSRKGSDALSSLRLVVPGDSFTIKMYSDGGATYYGFDCVVREATDDELNEYEVNRANLELNLIWENGTPKVTYEETTGADVTVQYMIGTNGTLKNATGGVIGDSALKLGDTVFVIVSRNGKQKDGGSVLVIDETNPVITKVETKEHTANSITVEVTATDNETGLMATDTYTYYKDGMLDGTSTTSNTHVYSYPSLILEPSPTLKVEVVDKAGNKASRDVYIVYYADVDDNGTVDGVIYADLAESKSGNWGRQTYSYTKKDGLKEYYIKKASYKYNDGLGEHPVIAPVEGTSEEKDRFYVMALVDMPYDGSWDNNFSSHNQLWYGTETGFGKGRNNTGIMVNISDWTSKDIWTRMKSEYNEGWFVPSKEEWVAFVANLGVTTSNCNIMFKLKQGFDYWSSSQYSFTNNGVVDYGCAWKASFRDGSIGGASNVRNVLSHVRLSTTF